MDHQDAKITALVLTCSFRCRLRQRDVHGRRATATSGVRGLCPSVRASESGRRPRHQTQLLLQRAGVPGHPTVAEFLSADRRDLQVHPESLLLLPDVQPTALEERRAAQLVQNQVFLQDLRGARRRGDQETPQSHLPVVSRPLQHH